MADLNIRRDGILRYNQVRGAALVTNGTLEDRDPAHPDDGTVRDPVSGFSQVSGLKSLSTSRYASLTDSEGTHSASSIPDVENENSSAANSTNPSSRAAWNIEASAITKGNGGGIGGPPVMDAVTICRGGNELITTYEIDDDDAGDEFQIYSEFKLQADVGEGNLVPVVDVEANVRPGDTGPYVRASYDASTDQWTVKTKLFLGNQSTISTQTYSGYSIDKTWTSLHFQSDTTLSQTVKINAASGDDLSSNGGTTPHDDNAGDFNGEISVNFKAANK